MIPIQMEKFNQGHPAPGSWSCVKVKIGYAQHARDTSELCTTSPSRSENLHNRSCFSIAGLPLFSTMGARRDSTDFMVHCGGRHDHHKSESPAQLATFSDTIHIHLCPLARMAAATKVLVPVSGSKQESYRHRLISCTPKLTVSKLIRAADNVRCTQPSQTSDLTIITT